MKRPVLTLLDIYIIKKFLGTFVFATALILVIATVFDLSEHIDDFLEHDVSLKQAILGYYVNFIPYFAILFSSLINFIAVIFFTSKMAYNTEIIAILSSGVSFARLMRPYFISATIIALFSFYMNNYLLPPANKKRLDFSDRYFRSGPRYFSQRNVHKQIRPNVYIYMESYSNNSNIGYKFSMEKFDRNKLVSKMMADYIRWDSVKGKWNVRNYYIRNIYDGKEELLTGTSLDTTLNLSPNDFAAQDNFIFETMTLPFLNRYIDQLKLQGADNINVFQVEKGRRTAAPFSTYILTFIAVALSSRKVRGGIGMHIGAGLGLAFSYIFFMQFSSQFAISGSIPPMVAAWIPNMIYLVICVFLYRLAPK